VRKAIFCLGLALFLGGCGGSSDSGTTVAPRPRPPSAAVLQHNIERDYGLHDAHCEQNVHGGARGHFICLADSRSLRLQLGVTQARPGVRPAITSCEGTRKIGGKSFVTCSFGPPKTE